MWILATILGLILFFLILLSIPVDLRLIVVKEDNFRSTARIEWLFGLVGKDLERKKKKPKAKKKKKKKFKARRHVKPFLAFIRTRGLIRRFLKLLRDIRRVIHIRELRLNLRIGFDDPFDTAMLFGAIGPTAFVTNYYSPLSVRVYPDFEAETFRGYFSGNMRIVPIKLFKPLILFGFSPVTLRAAKNMVLGYRK